MPLATLERRVEAGELTLDLDQRDAAARLDRLAKDLADYEPAPSAPKKSFLGRFLRRGGKPDELVDLPQGVYLWGGVGRGKSMLMDLFYDNAPVEKKRRVHFHEFMIEVHRRLHELRGKDGEDRPIELLAREIAAQTSLLCFDEFHVVNIADAMILGRLFERLFGLGVVVVATSNWPPGELYKDGLNRQRFLPFIKLLESRVEVVGLDGPVDYRSGGVVDLPVFLHPLDDENDRRLEAIFAELTQGLEPGPCEVEVGARTLKVPRAAGGVALFTFKQLCERPLGAADYLALTERFAAVLIKGVPRLTPDKRNEARRFMTLVDAFYERKVLLFATSEAAPEDLYTAGEGAFEFQRTVSRLSEMQSRGYRAGARARRQSGGFAAFEPYALTSDLV